MDIEFFEELHNKLTLEMRLNFLRNTLGTQCNTLEEYWGTEEGKLKRQELIDKFNTPPGLSGVYNPFIYKDN